MPSTKRFRNFKDVSHNAVAITGVKSVRMNRGFSLISDAADADAFITHRVIGLQDPSYSVTTQDASALLAVGSGARGVFTYKWLESYSQTDAASSGTIVVTTNDQTVFAGASNEGSFQQLGTQSLEFATCSADGVTNPSTVTIL